MKVLAKWKTCKLVISLVVMLCIVGTATSEDQTDLSIGETKQMTHKSTIMILGSGHLSNPGMDSLNYKMDDVLAPKRQQEIEQLVTQLRAFQPTKIALEVDERFEAGINVDYQAYLKGTYELKRGEGNQIGFRLAKQMEHSKVYCVDHFRNYSQEPDEFFPEDFDWDLLDFDTFGKEHNVDYRLKSTPTEGKVTRDKDGTIWIESEKYEPIIDMYIRHNEPEGRLADHQGYLRIARIGLGDQYPGANWVTYMWYARNLKIFVNITRITESDDERILLIIGAGHVHLIQQFLEDSGNYILESPLKYLDAAEK